MRTMEFTEYEREEAQLRDWDSSALEIFEFVRARIATKLPETTVEHIGSSSVPGMPGKGYVDVMVLPSDATEIAHAVRELEALGLQHARGSRPERPFFLAAVQHNGRVTNVHVHVIISESDEARAQRGLARALRDDPKLRDEYAAVKQQVVDTGATDPTEYSIRKVRWVLETLERLGLPRLPDPGDPPATHRDR